MFLKFNLFLLQLSPDTRNVVVSATGQGFALLEISYKYNIKEAEPLASFVLRPVATLLNRDHMSLEITIRCRNIFFLNYFNSQMSYLMIFRNSFQPPKEANNSTQSNMAVLEISFPSGFVVNPSALELLKDKLKTVKKIECKNADTLAIVYFDNITTDPVSLSLDGFRNHLVTEQKPASVIIYDYYDNCKLLDIHLLLYEVIYYNKYFFLF